MGGERGLESGSVPRSANAAVDLVVGMKEAMFDDQKSDKVRDPGKAHRCSVQSRSALPMVAAMTSLILDRFA